MPGESGDQPDEVQLATLLLSGSDELAGVSYFKLVINFV